MNRPVVRPATTSGFSLANLLGAGAGGSQGPGALFQSVFPNHNMAVAPNTYSPVVQDPLLSKVVQPHLQPYPHAAVVQDPGSCAAQVARLRAENHRLRSAAGTTGAPAAAGDINTLINLVQNGVAGLAPAKKAELSAAVAQLNQPARQAQLAAAPPIANRTQRGEQVIAVLAGLGVKFTNPTIQQLYSDVLQRGGGTRTAGGWGAGCGQSCATGAAPTYAQPSTAGAYAPTGAPGTAGALPPQQRFTYGVQNGLQGVGTAGGRTSFGNTSMTATRSA